MTLFMAEASDASGTILRLYWYHTIFVNGNILVPNEIEIFFLHW